MDNELISIAIEKMKTITDPEHTLSHTLDVVDYANEIMSTVKADRDVVMIACYWHDVGRTITSTNHEQISGELLKEEMVKRGYSKDKIDSCYNAIIYHKWSSKPITIEGNIVRDADKLGFLGRRRWNNCIDHNFKLTSIISNIPKLRNEYLHFDISKIIYDRDIKYINYLLKTTKW